MIMIDVLDVYYIIYKSQSLQPFEFALDINDDSP